ncbi:MAG: S-methyl-5-thioribose-1-phosphate isomerase [Planctomycetaceae bacterium]
MSNVVQTLRWSGGIDGSLWLLDQTLLPTETREVECGTVEKVHEAIRMLRVRGAPAIGVAAGYGVVVGMQTVLGSDRKTFDARLIEVTDYLAGSRPTAVNLFMALDVMKACAAENADAAPEQLMAVLLDAAKKLEAEDKEMCAAIGRHGAELLEPNTGALTHCNAGGLATAGSGTALSVFFEAASQGRNIHVYADETRPLLQGARLTTWELMRRDIPTTLICDSMAAQVMKEGKIQAVVTGADRIASNGDAANKIGTYAVALLAKAHDIPFYVAAPSTTFDMTLASGDEIPIEQRDASEITHGFGRQTAPDETPVYNPAFDVTPAELIAAIITERGVIRPVTADHVAAMISG